jgi:hypothetical protein
MIVRDDGPDALPTRVLLLARDRRFRLVASMLLQRRGYAVAVGWRTFALATAARRTGAEVVVLDPASVTDIDVLAATWPESLDWVVGLVVVSDEPVPAPDAARVVAKWGPMQRLSEAIDSVRPIRATA